MSEMIYGIHAVQALLERAPERFQEVFILKGREDKRLMPLIHALEAQGVVIQLANRQFLDEKSEGAVHQGIIARVKPGRQYQENDLPDLIGELENPFFLILDGVTDPHNLGACLRSADAAGVHAVIVPKDRSAQLNATAKKVACGAAENVPLIRVTNLARTMRLLQEENIWIVGTAGEADHTLYQSKMTGRLALVMGAEGEGMRRLTREHCDELISIPMAGSVSSLNVSVATGSCLFEAVRQRGEPVMPGGGFALPGLQRHGTVGPVSVAPPGINLIPPVAADGHPSSASSARKYSLLPSPSRSTPEYPDCPSL